MGFVRIFIMKLVMYTVNTETLPVVLVKAFLFIPTELLF